MLISIKSIVHKYIINFCSLLIKKGKHKSLPIQTETNYNLEKCSFNTKELLKYKNCFLFIKFIKAEKSAKITIVNKNANL